ncbi:hypothetical protein BH24DEI1_BH24DEI1_10970 [soil metagenome]
MKLQEQLTGYLFILPATLLIAIFGLFPILYAAYMSTHRWRVRQGPFVGLENFTRTLGDWSGAGLLAGGLALLLVAYWLGAERLKAPPLAGAGERLLRTLPALLLSAGALFAVGSGWERMTVSGDARFLGSLVVTLYYAVGAIPVQIALGLVIAAVLFQGLKGQEFFRMMFFVPYVVPVAAAAVVFGRLFSPRETGFMNTVFTTLGLEPQRWLHDPRPSLHVFFLL